jgi:glycosyltransferase involved in cell wall biosynthesis
MRKVSAIICAYNEEKTLKDVILSISESLIVSEIIVVNDGSSDSTKKIIEELQKEIEITAINLTENKGKGYAMAVGVENSIFDIMLFVDADQSNIIHGYINQLTNPLLNKESDIVLGYSTINILNQDVNPLKILTGERALYKEDIIPILDKMKESRFGVETLLYFYYISIGKSIKFIRLKGMTHKDKYKKMSSFKATTGYINEGFEIAYTAFKNYELLLKSVEKQISKRVKQ